jgi:hypothetical protein
MTLIDSWDTGQPNAYWDSGLEWDVNYGPAPGSIGGYLALVPPENQGAPNFMAMLALLLRPLADIQAVTASMPGLFDVDSAVGVQLDAVGTWVGASRYLLLPLANVYFSLDVAGLGLDQGIFYSPGDPLTELTTLPDSYYRLVVKAKILNNQWDGTVPGAYAIWNEVFAGTGIGILIQDYGNMHMALALTGTAPDAVTLGLFTSGYLNVKPAGVRIDWYMTLPTPNVPYFGLDAENASVSGLDFGYFGDLLPGDQSAPSPGVPYFGLDYDDSSIAGLDVGSFFV